MASYNNKDLKEYFTSELVVILSSLHDAEKKRNEAASHPKFDKSHPKYVGSFPPPNPEFLKLKAEIIKELESRKNGK